MLLCSRGESRRQPADAPHGQQWTPWHCSRPPGVIPRAAAMCSWGCRPHLGMHKEDRKSGKAGSMRLRRPSNGLCTLGCSVGLCGLSQGQGRRPQCHCGAQASHSEDACVAAGISNVAVSSWPCGRDESVTARAVGTLGPRHRILASRQVCSRKPASLPRSWLHRLRGHRKLSPGAR